MPAFITHALFGDDLLAWLPADLQQLVRSEFYSYSLGLQGPDLLFFRNVLRGGSPLNGYGSQMHQENTRELLQALAAYCIRHKGCSDERAVLAYAIGFIGHYTLDARCHPYIYWWQEELAKQTPRRIWPTLHHTVEGMMDSALYRVYTYRPATAFPFERYFTLDGQVTAPISLLYEHLLKEVYGIAVSPGEVSLSIRDAYRCCKLELDPTGGLVLQTARLTEWLFNRPTGWSCFFKKSPTFDVLNLECREWHPLHNPEAVRRATVPELLEAARKWAGEIIYLFADAVRLESPYDPGELPTFDDGSPRMRDA